MNIRHLALGAAALLLPWGSPAFGEVVEYSAGHADIGLLYENGQLILHYRFDQTSIIDGSPPSPDGYAYAPAEVAVRGVDASGQNFDTVPPGFEFTGMSPDGAAAPDLWILPQANVAGLPFLGLAAEELDAGDWAEFVAWRLTGVSGPGFVSIWQADLFGPLVLSTTVDGLDANDQFFGLVGGHEHYFWGFTEPGAYMLKLEASIMHETDGLVTTSDEFLFLIGDAVTAPEPSTSLLISVGALIGGFWWNRRRRSFTRASRSSLA